MSKAEAITDFMFEHSMDILGRNPAHRIIERLENGLIRFLGKDQVELPYDRQEATNHA